MYLQYYTDEEPLYPKIPRDVEIYAFFVVVVILGFCICFYCGCFETGPYESHVFLTLPL